MNGELVFVGADLVTDATLPRAGLTMQRRMQEEHASLEEQNIAILALKELALSDVIA